ncbi:MAG TPA: hypothetical protein VM925_04275 [Labilithrix sp.]|nr:hypothetical protein [Labilithrix sp.]
MRGRAGSASVIAVVLAALGCARSAPPAPDGIDAAVSPLPAPPAVSPAIASTAHPSGIAPESGAPTSPASVVDAGDPGALPQTRDKPAPASPVLEARARALWDGIVRDDPELAIPFFFPVTAYEQVKAIPSPASDWRRRLVAAYKRDVHGLNKRLGDKAGAAKLVRLDIPDERARWVEPNEESNKLGYWRVYGTRIVYEVDGKERTLDVSSLISWRGEWYVVHLTGFK